MSNPLFLLRACLSLFVAIALVSVSLLLGFAVSIVALLCDRAFLELGPLCFLAGFPMSSTGYWMSTTARAITRSRRARF